MQETRYPEHGTIKTVYEFFQGTTDEDVHGQMARRLKTLEERGHTLVRRVNIGRNDVCLCGSGLKFKRCCVDKVQIYK